MRRIVRRRCSQLIPERLPKTNGATIFLPAGCRNGTGLYYTGNHGYYWSSSLREDYSDDAYYLGFYDDDIYRDDNYRYYGRSVRAVLR